jgi:acyl dehydratase
MDEYYEDVVVGDAHDLGTYEVTGAEVREFAARYDPQSVHTGDGEPETSLVDGPVASGWHTAAMTMRVLVDGYLRDSGALLATGVDRLRWPTPVHPGDTLRVSLRVENKQPHSSADLGEVAAGVSSHTDDGVVLSMVGNVLFPRRETDSTGAGASGEP